jgi:hypothetical protein
MCVKGKKPAHGTLPFRSWGIRKHEFSVMQFLIYVEYKQASMKSQKTSFLKMRKVHRSGCVMLDKSWRGFI